MITFNALSGHWLNKTTIDSIVPAAAEAVPFLAGKSLVWALGVYVATVSSISALNYLANVIIKLGPVDFIKHGLPGIVPITQWVLAVWFTFSSTEWAWAHPSLALQLLLPGFCLINSKMIVCNVTNMQSEWHSWTFMWFLLFPLNKYLGGVAPEWTVALLVYFVNMGTYLTFAVCTIGQLTEFLDIYCLTIKKKASTAKVGSDNKKSS